MNIGQQQILHNISQNKRIKLSCTFVWRVIFELAYISDILVIFQFQMRDTSVKHGIITISRSLFSNYEQKAARRSAEVCFLLSNCLNWKIYCDDHSSISSTTAVQNMNYFIYFTSFHSSREI